MSKLGEAVIKSRGSFLSAFFFAGLIATIGVEARADIDLIDTRAVTNASQLAEVAFSGWCSVYLPDTAWEWKGYSTDGVQPWWVNCSQWPCFDLSPASTNVNGVALFTVRLTKNVLSGEITFQSDTATDVLVRVEAPSDYQPGARVEDRGVWWMWQQATNCPDCWGIEGEIPPPTVTLKVLLADVQNKPTWDEAIAAQEANYEAEQAAMEATRFTSDGMFGAMTEDEGDGEFGLEFLCTITNEAAPFRILSLSVSNGVNILFQSCSDHAYLVASTDTLTTNTVWSYRAAIVPGQDGTTPWTDTSTVGTNILARFYRVQRLWLRDSVGDRIPDWWRQFYFGQATSTNGNNSCADCDPDGDGLSNYQEYLNGTDPNALDSLPLIVVNADNPYTGSLTVSIQPSGTNFPNILVSRYPSMTNATVLANSGSPISYTLPDNGDGVYYLYFQYADGQGRPRSAVVAKAVTVDRVSPVVSISAPASNAVLDQAFITLEAVAYDSEPSPSGGIRPLSIWINDQRYWDRSATNITVTRFPVPAGTNAFTVAVRAADDAGHTTLVTRTWAVNPAGDTNAPQLSLFNITNMVLPDVRELWVEAAVDDSNALIDAVVTSSTGEVSTNSLGVNGLKAEGLVPLNPGTNIMVVTARDAAGNTTSNIFTVIRSNGYRAEITSPAFGEFATAPSNYVSGYVSAKIDEGLPTEKNVTSVTINGITAVLGGVDAIGNRSFTSAQQIPVGEAITGEIATDSGEGMQKLGEGDPTPPITIPPAQSGGYEVLTRELHADVLEASRDYADQPAYDWATCQLFCSDWYVVMTRISDDEEYDSTSLSTHIWEVDAGKAGNMCVSDPHPETFTWQAFQTMDWTNRGYSSDRFLSFGSSTLDGSVHLPGGTCRYGYPMPPYLSWELGLSHYHGTLVFRAPRQYATNTTVVFTFEGGNLGSDSGLDLSQIKYRGQSPIAWSNEAHTVSYLVTVDGGREYTINEDSFQWPSKTYPVVRYGWGPGEFPYLATVNTHYLCLTNFYNHFVKITKTDPDISVLCAGCTMQFYADTNPHGRSVKWSITLDDTHDASISTNGLLSIGSNAVNGNVTVRAADAEVPQAYDERSIFVFVAPANANHTTVRGQSLSPSEIGLAISHPWDSLGLNQVAADAKAQTAIRFTNANDRADGAIGNAFQHAYGSCLAAQRYGADRAKQAGDAHEAYTGNPCNEAAMDLYNNGVGRSLACPSCDCDQAVMQALSEGKLRWQETIPPPPCPQYDSKPNTIP